MIFNERLKQLRMQKQVTQKQMAEILGLTERNYQRYEADGPMPRYPMLLSIADYFDVSLDYLFGRTEHREVNR